MKVLSILSSLHLLVCSGQCRRRWSNIEPTLGKRRVFAGLYQITCVVYSATVLAILNKKKMTVLGEKMKMIV